MIEVLFEDNHIIAVNKQSGDIVQGDKTGDKTLGEKVALFLKNKYGIFEIYHILHFCQTHLKLLKS